MNRYLKSVLVEVMIEERRTIMGEENMNFATELLHEVKQSAKRWFIAFCIMVVLEIATIAGFLWYISLPVEEYSYTEQTMDDIDGENINQTINNGTDGGN